MPDEKPAPLPLSGEEIQEAILFKIQQSLGRTCHLIHDSAYTSFRAEISVKLTLSDFGREVRDNHILDLAEDSGLVPQTEPRTLESNITMEPMPPNQVRVETEQAVPVAVVEGGKRTIRRVKYAARKSKIGPEGSK